MPKSPAENKAFIFHLLAKITIRIIIFRYRANVGLKASKDPDLLNQPLSDDNVSFRE
jgi:hypothetical protein